jgi:signal transduction histidine kinase/FixJ family two-component response regulator
MSKATIARANTLALVAIAALVAMLGLVNYQRFHALQAARGWVQHTYQALATIKDLDVALRGAESGERGYVLTGEPTYLAPYQSALARVSLIQGDLQRLTADDPAQQEHIRVLAPLLQRKLESMAQTVELRRSVGLDAALATLRNGSGQQLMDDIEAALTVISADEQRLLGKRLATEKHSAALTRWLTLASTAASLLLLAWATRMLNRARVDAEHSTAEQRMLATRLKASLDSLSQGVGVFGADNRLVHWNECFQILLDVPKPMVREGTPYAAFVEQTAAQADAPFLETEEQLLLGRTHSGPIVYERTRAPDSHVLEIRRTPTPGNGFVLTISDMTQRAQADAVLREAQKMQAVGQLTGGIAHDFNNLLTVILGNLEFASGKLRGDEALLSRIQRAEWAAHRGATLTKQLLAFARKQALEPKPVNLSQALPEIGGLLQRTLGETIEVRVVDAAGLWNCMTDTAQLESVVLNLALNARDAMPGGGRLTIEVANKMLDEEYALAHAEVTAGDYVMLAISDTGQGMTPDVAARAFEPFFTTKSDGKGTGLGLAMVYGFVKQSDGHIKLYSEPGEGTTVRMYLPRVVGGAAPAQQPEAPLEIPHGQATILVVEDEAQVREITAAILRELGYRVLEAEDSGAALRVFGANAAEIDLLLVDVVLPGDLRGRDVAEQIAAIRPQTRIVYMSGYTANAIVHQGRLDDGVHLINKPFTRDQLARKVAQVLGIPDSTQERPADANQNSNVVDLAGRKRPE